MFRSPRPREALRSVGRSLRRTPAVESEPCLDHTRRSRAAEGRVLRRGCGEFGQSARDREGREPRHPRHGPGSRSSSSRTLPISPSIPRRTSSWRSPRAGRAMATQRKCAISGRRAASSSGGAGSSSPCSQPLESQRENAVVAWSSPPRHTTMTRREAFRLLAPKTLVEACHLDRRTCQLPGGRGVLKRLHAEPDPSQDFALHVFRRPTPRDRGWSGRADRNGRPGPPKTRRGLGQ